MNARDARIRVLHVIASYPPDFSGHGRQLCSLIPYLTRLGIRSAVLTSRVPPGGSAESVDGTEVCRLPRRPGRLGYIAFAARAGWWAARRRAQFDVVHYQGADWPGALGVPVLRLLGTKTVVTLTLLGVDDPISLGASRLGWLKVAMLRRADRVVAISGALADAARQARFGDQAIREIPVGVDVTRFFPPSAAQREEARGRLAARLGIDPQRPMVAFVGAVIRRKGIDVLMAAWPAVAAVVPGAALLIVGPTAAAAGNHEFADGFADLIVRSAHPPSVVVAGPMEDTAEIYRAADVFALPSRHEGLPNVLLEACACGLPSVVASLPGVTKEVIRDGESGLVVPQEDPDALSKALIRLLRDPDLRSALGDRARQEILARYTLDRVAAATVREYESLAGGSRAFHE